MIKITKVLPIDWKSVSKNTHAAVFGTVRDPDVDRIDFSLIVSINEVPLGYITGKELDSETVYWQFGGTLRKDFRTIRAYQMCIDEMKKYYKRITTCILNTNQTMLKMAMHVGFLINGVRYHDGKVLVELVKEL